MELKNELNEDELSNIVLGVAIDVHTQLGLRILENVYKKAQAINYLKLEGYALDLIINFNVSKLKYGFKRVVNTKGPRPL